MVYALVSGTSFYSTALCSETGSPFYVIEDYNALVLYTGFCLVRLYLSIEINYIGVYQNCILVLYESPTKVRDGDDDQTALCTLRHVTL